MEVKQKDKKITHLEDMIKKYHIKAEYLTKNYTESFTSIEKKIKRQKEAKNKLQDENKKLKRELLEKDMFWKRQLTLVKIKEINTLGEWDMNSYQTLQNQKKADFTIE